MKPRAVMLWTLIVGVLDIVEVILFYWFRGVLPIRILQGVAAGALGRDAFRGGVETAVTGLLLHFFIAFVVVAVYHLAAERAEVLRMHPIISGALYGLAVYAVMNYVVVPLSAAGQPAAVRWAVVANGLFAHVFCVGIPALSFQLSLRK